MPKFKDYPELTDPLELGDALIVLDASDTSESAEGTTKYLDAGNLGGGGGGVIERIGSRQTLNNSNASFTGLELSGYSRVILKGRIRTALATGFSEYVRLAFNGDTTTTNYEAHVFYYENAVLDQVETQSTVLVRAGTNNVGGDPTWTRFTIEIEGLESGQWPIASSTFGGRQGTQRNITGQGSLGWRNTASVIQIDFFCDNNLFGVVDLYGET
jgi:hypothetical protein